MNAATPALRSAPALRIALTAVLAAACGCASGAAGAGDVLVGDPVGDTEDAGPEPGPATYTNPILFADYSDPDAVRVGDDYWMTSSSFSQVPGLPILHSRDLVNWTLDGHALPRLVPEGTYGTPQHGKGVWAPSLRFHGDRYWIYYPDPDFGIYVITASDPRGPWTDPVLVAGGKGLIDPCPFWDDDGRVYLLHAWAMSFAGVNNRLTLLRLTADGIGVAEDLGVIIEGDALPGYNTLEGPKVYRRNGWIYVFAPAGGVAGGWQSVFRAHDLRGPYEARIVMDQGTTAINGPHQGALVDTPSGEWWFLHFQDRGVYGRVVHLQPVAWKDDWPVIGEDPDGDGKGQPVLVHQRPDLPAQPDAAPPTSDGFDSTTLGLQWQWQANPDVAWASLADVPGSLRLFAQPEPKPGNLYDAPSLLLQKFPAEAFHVTTLLDATGLAEGESAGLLVFGNDYTWLGLKRIDGVATLTLADGTGALLGLPRRETAIALPAGAADSPIRLRVTVRAGGLCRFGFSVDGVQFAPADTADFQATAGRWIGAKVGLFASSSAGPGAGHADFAEVVVAP